MKYFSRLLLYLALAAIVTFAFNPAWSGHASYDVSVFYSRAQHFFKEGSYATLKFNEYQPGALLYFALLSPALNIINSGDFFLKVFIGVNVLLCILYGEAINKYAGHWGIITYALIVIFSGPILLFRFEMFCHLLVFGSIYFWHRKKPYLSLFLLGWSIMTKVYPVILIPYFLMVAWQTYPLKKILKILLFSLGSFLLSVGAYFIILKDSPASIMSGLEVQSKKPLTIESVPAVVASSIKYWSTGKIVKLESYLMWGISQDELLGERWIYNVLWIIPLSIFYLWLSKKQNLIKKMHFSVIATLITLFLFFSSQLAPQYLLWFVLFLPLFMNQGSSKYKWHRIWLLITTLVMLLTAQVVFPIYYTELIEDFFKNNGNPDIFYILVIRNILLTMLAVFLTFNQHKFYKQYLSRVV